MRKHTEFFTMVDGFPDAGFPTLAMAIDRVKELKASDAAYPMLKHRDIWIEGH